MSRYVAGLVVSIGGLLAGGWLMLSPFALGYQPAGAAWTHPAVVNLATGAGICGVALLTLLLTAWVWRDRLRQEGILPPRRQRRVAKRAAEPPAGGPSAEDLRAVLAPLVAALTADREAAPPAGVPPPATGDSRVSAGTGTEGRGTFDGHEEQW